MKTTTPQFLAKSYAALNPDERLPLCQDTFTTFGNWLERYQREPDKALATTNWCGKVTRALFHSLGMKCPRTKGAMIAALTETEVAP